MQEKRFVTLSGECFDAEFQGEARGGRRLGTVHLFRLRDLRSGRGDLLVSLFRSEQLKLLNPNYGSRIELARINAIRRAFDTGKLSFGMRRDEHMYQSLDLEDSDLEQLPLVADADIRQFMTHKAYWLGYMHPVFQPNEPIGLDSPEDRDYLGSGEADMIRSITRLKNQGLLDKVMAGHGRPTEALISAYESKLQNATPTESHATLAEMPSGQPVTHKGLAVFISHSSKDAELAEALIDLLKSALGIRAEQMLRKIWNTPRQDRNRSDHSGPAKLGITVERDGEPQQCVLPVQMNQLFLNSTAFIQLVGSKTFVGT